MRKLVAISVALGGASACSACSVTARVPIQEVQRLNGFRAQDDGRPLLHDIDGDEVEFSGSTRLQIWTANGGFYAGRFEAIDVTPTEFHGILAGGERGLRLPLQDFRAVAIRHKEGARTAVLVAGIVVGVVATVVASYALLVASGATF